MAKLVLFGLLILIVYLNVRGKRHVRHDAPPQRPIEQMVVCAHCGVHLPENESLKSGQFHFCCEQHRALGADDRRP